MVITEPSEIKFSSLNPYSSPCDTNVLSFTVLSDTVEQLDSSLWKLLALFYFPLVNKDLFYNLLLHLNFSATIDCLYKVLVTIVLIDWWSVY